MEDLIYFYSHIDVFLLVFIRIIFAINFNPIITETKLPVLAIGGISTILTMITVFIIPDSMLYYEPNTITFFILIVKEAIVGIILAFSINIFFQIYHFEGQCSRSKIG